MSSSTRGARPRAGGRWSARSALVAVLSVVAMALAPGLASAATAPAPAPAAGTVKPVVNCYTDNKDGTYTAVLGYTNSGSTTREIAVGPANKTDPTAWQSKVPTSFKPGTNNGVASVVLTQAQANGQSPASWTLDGTTLNVSNVGNVPVCTASQMPMLANGAALLGGLVAAALVGVVVIRRLQRQAGVAPVGAVGA
ncbi:hypothetical protein SAMN05660199_00156 [Klenkia soli]|uniref:Uncharacterized protein n=1 Tax=Klenkia soli TaxID=1052260 RepID=A0A1H0BYG9_9ACTN|nr:hypothetical protein [Klenkia soli]SDN50738.1 hypothetical protein SAMN05660199_00156 [Klenkia soli]